MWSTGSDESKIKSNLKEAFVIFSGIDEEEELVEEPISIAEAALKVSYNALDRKSVV